MKKIKAKSRTLEAQLIAARKAARVARDKYEKALARYEASNFNAFVSAWTYKWFKYDMGYGFVLGEGEAANTLAIMDIHIEEQYEWVTIHELEWDMSRFEYWKATILDKDSAHVLQGKILDYTRNNFMKLGIDLYEASL